MSIKTAHTHQKTNPPERPDEAAPTSALQHASAMLDACFDAAFIAAPDGIIAGANTACSNMLEIPAQELIGMAADSIYATPGSYKCSTGETLLIDEDTVQMLLRDHARLLKTGRSSLAEIHCRTRQGLAVPVEQNSVVLYNSRGKASGTMTVMRTKTSVHTLHSIRERFNRLFENSFDGILLIDDAGIIRKANKAFERLSGRAAGEIIGRRFADVLFPGSGTYMCDNDTSVQIGTTYAEEIQDIVSRLNIQKIISGWQTWLIKKDCSAIFVEHSLAALSGPNNSTAGFLCIIRDITEKTILLDALQKSDARFRTFFEYAPDAIYISDVSGIFIDGNRSAEQLTGYSREELIGRNYFDLELLSPEQFPRALELLERNIAGNPTGPDEFDLQCRGGQLKTVEICTYPLYIEGERCVLGVAHDVTGRKRAETALNKARESLEVKVRERTQDIEEANAALRVLLKGRDEDRGALEESMLQNLHDLVLPCIEKLKTGKLQQRQRGVVEILETNLRDITAPMMRAVTKQHLRFTPAEISVANCIRHGKSTREIAELLQLSIKTVHFHRENIRKKCGIRNKKMNLRTFLASLA
jgi:PAS domain S-box-containing protein